MISKQFLHTSKMLTNAIKKTKCQLLNTHINAMYFETESSMNFFKFSCVSCLEISCARDIMGSLGVELTSHKDIFINCVNRYLPLPLVD